MYRDIRRLSILCLVASLFLQCGFSAPRVALAQVENKAADDSELVKLGFEFITNKRYLPTDFDQETFDQVWRSWPADLKSRARHASAEERRRMAFARYGFTPRKDDPSQPLQFVVEQVGDKKFWSMNCFSCHGGSAYGSTESYPGLPNNRIALETLYEDLRTTKRLLKKPLSMMDLGATMIPMGSSVGTSNAVIFGVGLMAFRDKHLRLKSFVVPPIVQHHDMDAPPWWNHKFKKMLYIDGFTAKNHRALMPFLMVKQNHREKFISFEKDFLAVQKFIESVEAPKYKGSIDESQARLGQVIFQDHCAKCHGEYEPEFEYPELTVDIKEIGTDPVRLNALSKDYRRRYGESWLGKYGKAKTISEPKGYVAPPLKGIWASAPYLHNGSVPTLRGVLIPARRPKVWIRSSDGFDDRNVGLIVKLLEEVPQGLSNAERRRYFDSRKFGKSNRGHDFGKHLSVEEQNQLLEYLKTL